jgi:hypothetical protein
MRRWCGLLVLAVLIAACGGGGGGGDGGSNPPPIQTLYVRATGNDDNDGLTPATAFKTVANAALQLKPGRTIYVGPGRYRGRVQIAGVDGSAAKPGRIIADPTGERTGDAPGDVILDGAGELFAVRIQNAAFITIDGFIITGAQDAPDATASAVRVQGASANATIQHCVINNGRPVDGIRIEGASDALIFNNLIVDNNAGVVIRGRAPRAQVINNTIANNASFGIRIVASRTDAPTDATLRNNIVQDSGNNVSIDVDTGPPSAVDSYSGDFNLAFVAVLGDQATTYRPANIRGPHDVNLEAGFVDPTAGDFHLGDESRAIDAGSGAIDHELLDQLLQRTSAESGALDAPPVDLGYHYPASL